MGAVGNGSVWKKRQRKKSQQNSGWRRKERAVYWKQAKEGGSLTIAGARQTPNKVYTEIVIWIRQLGAHWYPCQNSFSEVIGT